MERRKREKPKGVWRNGINTEMGEKGFEGNQSPDRNSWRLGIYVFAGVTNSLVGAAMRGEPCFK